VLELLQHLSHLYLLDRSQQTLHQFQHQKLKRALNVRVLVWSLKERVQKVLIFVASS
jgi:hypothetical protein